MLLRTIVGRVNGRRPAVGPAVSAPGRRGCALLLLGLIACEGAKGTTLHSCDDGAEAFLDDETYYRTIQVALDHALDGDVVHVCPGEHSAVLDVGTVNDANPLYHDGGTLTLAGDPDGSSVLNAGGKGAVLVTDRVSFTLTDLTFTRGTGFRYGDGADVPYYAVGGAIYDRGGADLSLVRVRIEGNRADDGRGAAFYVDGDPLHPNMVTLSDCAVLNNGPGSAAAFRTGYRFTATTTDWGEGSMDNQSRDIVLSTDDGEVGYDVPKGASVECDSVTDTCVFG